MNVNIVGRVIKGEGYGRKLGFPTVNLDSKGYVRRKLKIKPGVWTGETQLKIKNSKFKIYRAGIVIGPLDKHGLPKIEAHLIGFKGNLYGRKISLHLVKYLRPFKKFKNETELKAQIARDVKLIKKLNYL